MPTIFFDFDSTVCTKESLDEVIALALKNHPDKESLVAKVEDITNRGMSGELDFMASVSARLDTCPLSLTHFESVGSELVHHLTPGMEDLFSWLSDNSWDVFIISGGFRPSILPAAKHLGLSESQVFANDVVVNSQGGITGVDTNSWLWTNDGKSPVISFLKNDRNLSDLSVLVGDGSNDLAAYKAGVVDHFVGFGANVVREKIKTESPHFVYSVSALKSYLANLS